MVQAAFTVAQTREAVFQWKKEGLSIGLVPTMGYLHAGHKSLIDKSVKDNDRTVVSIFVNPTQFAPNEDLEKYPRDFESDLKLCADSGASLVFHPAPEEMYGKDYNTYVNVDELTRELCGKSRPTHFRGVCTVVTKLFNIVQPDRAYFGQKDAQQLAVVRRMAEDLNIPVEIVGCPIVRESDGLAVSSRNKYLSEEERAAALILSKAIADGKRLCCTREPVSTVVAGMAAVLEQEPLARVDYVDAVDARTMEKADDEAKGEILFAMAVYIGQTRLIDNFTCCY